MAPSIRLEGSRRYDTVLLIPQDIEGKAARRVQRRVVCVTRRGEVLKIQRLAPDGRVLEEIRPGDPREETSAVVSHRRRLVCEADVVTGETDLASARSCSGPDTTRRPGGNHRPHERLGVTRTERHADPRQEGAAMTHHLLRPAVTALAVALIAPTALAQNAANKPVPAHAAPSDPVAELLRRQGERYHHAPDSAQDPDELRRTQALNAEIVAQNDLAENEDRANAAAYAREQARYQAELEAAEAERLRHESDLRTAIRAQADYERQMAEWQATVAACERGDRARCNAGRRPGP